MRYKIKFSSITPKISKENLYNENCYVGISINNDFFWGKHTDIFFEWIDKRFRNCKVIIADYLHRHNEIIFNNLNNEEAGRKGLFFGDRMIEFLDDIKVLKSKTFEIIRWNDIYQKEETTFFKNKLRDYYFSNKEFNFLVDSSAKEFISRQVKCGKLPYVKRDISLSHSRDYIIEELAIICYFIKNDYKVQIYPGTHLPMLNYFVLNNIDIDTKLSQGIYVDLKTIKIK